MLKTSPTTGPGSQCARRSSARQASSTCVKSRAAGDGLKRKVKRRGADIYRQFLLEILCARPGREPARPQRFKHRTLVVAVDEWLMKRQERRSHRGSTVRGEHLKCVYCHAISFIVGHLRMSVKPRVRVELLGHTEGHTARGGRHTPARTAHVPGARWSTPPATSTAAHGSSAAGSVRLARRDIIRSFNADT